MAGLREPIEQIPVKDKPKPKQRTLRLHRDEMVRLPAAGRESRREPLAAIRTGLGNRVPPLRNRHKIQLERHRPQKRDGPVEGHEVFGRLLSRA